jgi:hypothetical protein
MLDFLLPVVIGIFIGWVMMCLVQAAQAVNQALAISPDAQDTLVKLTNETLVILEVEPVNDQFLCYNYFTKEFVCTGRNMEEIRDRFRQRYPDKDAAVTKGDPDALRILKQQLEVLHENCTNK